MRESQMPLAMREVGNVVIFDIDGDLTLVTIEKIGLHRSVKAMLEKDRMNFLINYDKVPFMDSTGVGELLASYVSIQNAGGRLKLEKVNEKILLIFRVTGIIRLFENAIFEDEETALKMFA
jgi:anti-sigma B factor antagonist